nr:reverse transcriptase domain-containing protein [Tanacetum cinerariifolium]
MPPKRTSTSAAPAMTQAAIRQLVTDSVVAALEAQAAKMENNDNSNRNSEPRRTPIARKCTYKEFMSFQPFYFNGTEGAVELIRWFEQIELVFFCSNYTKNCIVKYAISNLTDEALSWWNLFAQPIRIEEDYEITWSEFKRLLIKKYCPQTEIKKMEETITITQRIIEQVSDLQQGRSSDQELQKQRTSHWKQSVTNAASEYYCDMKNINLEIESYQIKVNLTAPSITFPGIETLHLYSIIADPFVGIIYENIKKEKIAMNVVELQKFSDATLKRVLRKISAINVEARHGFKNPHLSKQDKELMILFEEEIVERLKVTILCLKRERKKYLQLHDDLSATKLLDGRIKVWIHVVDPSSLIEPASMINRESLRRGTSIFLPTITYPMFKIFDEGTKLETRNKMQGNYNISCFAF